MNLSILDIGNVKDLDSVKDIIGQNVNDSLKDYLHSKRIDQFIGNFQGKVVNNNDPDKLGKCQIRVYGIFESTIPDDDLPWAIPDMEFVGSTVGSFIVPPVGAIVNVYFDRGDLYLPHYTTKAVIKNKLPTQKDTDYPDNMVFFETDEGDWLTINRKSKETTFNHNSGTKVLIKKDGSIEVTIEKDLNINVTGNADIDATGTVKVKGASVELLGTLNTAVAGAGIQGGFCAITGCLFTGSPHVSKKLD